MIKNNDTVSGSETISASDTPTNLSKDVTMESTTIRQAEVRHFVDLPRFGSFHYTDSEAIAFPWGLPGFAELRRFVVLTVPTTENVIWLQSLERLEIAIPLTDPWRIFEDYSPSLPESALLSLEIEAPDDFSLLNVLVAESAQGEVRQFLNLLAPVVINLKKKVGRQVMLEGTEYSIRTPIAVFKKAEEAEEESE